MPLEEIVFSGIKLTFEIVIADGFTIRSTGKIPNKFHRYMQKIFFGFKYKKLEE